MRTSDELTKELVKFSSQDFVSWVCPGAQFNAELDKELTELDKLIADALLEATWLKQKIIIHIEFQRRRDEKMSERMWRYNLRATHRHNCPILSFVIYLLQDNNIVKPPYTITSPSGEPIHIFHYTSIKLWELQGEVLQQPGLEGLLPLLPLTKNGKRKEVVETMIQGLQAGGKEDLCTLGLSFAGLVFTTEAEKDWLQRRGAMLHEIIEESWFYQEIKAEGKAETLRAVLVRDVKRFFPELTPLAEQVSQSTDDPERLQQIVDAIFDAKTLEEARAILTQP